jgi:hypothetical protein
MQQKQRDLSEMAIPAETAPKSKIEYLAAPTRSNAALRRKANLLSPQP